MTTACGHCGSIETHEAWCPVLTKGATPFASVDFVPAFNAEQQSLLASRKPRTAPQLLQKAYDLMEERGKQYDQPQGERSMGRAVAALNIVLGREALTESEGWLLMQILKDVRDRQTTAPHPDSLEDCVAYSALKAEARLGECA